MAAGLGHCLGVTQKGDVVAWGWAAAGQLGLGHSHQGSHTVVHPTQVCMLVPLNTLCTMCMLYVNLHAILSMSCYYLSTGVLASGYVSGGKNCVWQIRHEALTA